MRILYNLLIYLLQIPLAAYWFFRSLINRSYRGRTGHRFGFGYPQLASCVWIHAVSVGEVQAAVPLVRALARRLPGVPILVTTVTPTGAARVTSVFGTDVTHAYIPLEMPLAIDRFFDAVKPKLALVMETEIWPNLYRACGVREIPLVLVSARISPRSVNGYRRFLPLFRETLSHGIIIAAQSAADAERFLSLGASPERVQVTGNIKFDIELPEALATQGARLRSELFGDRTVWIAASTHEGEETKVLEAHRSLRQSHGDLLLIVVPRHPERFSEVRNTIEEHAFSCVSRSDRQSCSGDVEVFLLDTMGELPAFYAASDIAFVGGSLVPVGGHNLLEPAALGLPVVIGPHVFNAQELVDLFVTQGACQMVRDVDELARSVASLLADPPGARRQGILARDLVQANRGALDRLMRLIEPLLDAAQDSNERR